MCKYFPIKFPVIVERSVEAVMAQNMFLLDAPDQVTLIAKLAMEILYQLVTKLFMGVFQRIYISDFLANVISQHLMKSIIVKLTKVFPTGFITIEPFVERYVLWY